MRNKGFTLIELLVTMGLIAVVSAGVISLIGRGPQQTSRDARRRADVEKIASALELYRSDFGIYPNAGSLGTSLVTRYMNTLPTDPVGVGVNYNYQCTGGCSGFTICANLEKTVATCPNDFVVTNP